MLELRKVCKTFPGNVKALQRVDFNLKRGEVHALLGENGAGKTTLMNILFGLYKMDKGSIIIDGKKVKIHSPSDALKLGIGMVQQHFTLVPSFNAVENIALGLSVKDISKVAKRIDEISQRYGLTVNLWTPVWQLSVGERQRIEILKLLYSGARVIILDEPTAVLTPQESDSLFRAIRKMVHQGSSVIFISHKLKEVMDISDRVTVLKNGRNVGTLQRGEFDARKLANMMVGRDIVLRTKKTLTHPGSVVLEVENLSSNNDRDLPCLFNVSLNVRSGEILGIAGVAGNGQKELSECITGLRIPTAGRILFSGTDITKASVSKRIQSGICYIPEDRKGVATCPNLSVGENLYMKSTSSLWYSPRVVASHAGQLMKKYAIQAKDHETPVKLLSGGNLQKVVIARELESNPRLIVAEHPTRGLDVGSMEFVYKTLIQARDQGCAVLLIAGDLDEIFTLSDRVAVMYEGRIVGYTEPDASNLEKIGLMMAGAVSETKS